MTDRVSESERSQMMAAVRGTDTAPELYVRRQLFAAGFRYRIHASDLLGKPDIVLPRFKTIVFVHGCFWHGHACPKGKRPQSNAVFWNAKIEQNIVRDSSVRTRLMEDGWTCVVIWQCQLKSATKRLLRTLTARKAVS